MAKAEKVSIEANLKNYEAVKRNGRKSYDRGDEVAVKLRTMDLPEIYDYVAKQLDKTSTELKKRLNHLNTGMQRMNLGNMLRAQMRADGKLAPTKKPAAKAKGKTRGASKGKGGKSSRTAKAKKAPAVTTS